MNWSRIKTLFFSIVGYPTEVESLYFELFKIAAKKTILVDMTTSSPELAKRLYILAKKSDLSILDAPVTGGDKGAILGNLSIMVGGDEPVFKTVLPLF